MSPQTAARAGAGRAASGPAGRRPTPTPKADRLEQLSSRLDRLIHDVRIDARSHNEFERLVEEAESIASGIRGVFRGSSTQNPPIAQRGGRAWW